MVFTVSATDGLSTPPSALAIAAHPDDVEFNCGATLARWADAGCEVHMLICTDGSKGSWDATVDPHELAATRQDEQRDAANSLGIHGEVLFMGEVDGELKNTLPLRNRIAEEIRRLRPAIVLAHDPWRRYRLHPDHREAGFLATEAIVAARDPHFLPASVLDPYRPEGLLLFEADEPNHVEPAGNAHAHLRIAALEAHHSQFESTHHAEFVGSVDRETKFRESQLDEMKATGQEWGHALAEAFHLISEL